jgi:hypothetical protein
MGRNQAFVELTYIHSSGLFRSDNDYTPKLHLMIGYAAGTSLVVRDPKVRSRR